MTALAGTYATPSLPVVLRLVHAVLHSGIRLMIPSDVHYSRAPEVIRARQQVLDGAWRANPGRFLRKRPEPRQLPRAPG